MRHLDPFERQLAAAWPPADWQEVGVMVAVSGGADSVALVRALAALKTVGAGRLAVAHFNHRLRGEASDADGAFVAELCGRLSLECIAGSADRAALLAAGDGLEAAARHARYEFLRGAALSRGARYLATAHTADDQAETVLHHILRGTGLAGLAGMTRARTLGPDLTLIRPMLGCRRADVLAYLAAIDQPYRDDPTNAELQFTRNRIRHELLPMLARDYAPGVVESLLRLANLAGDAQRAIESAASALLARATVESGALGVSLDCGALAGCDRHLVREVFVAVWRARDWPLGNLGFAEWDLLAEMAMNQNRDAADKRVLPGAMIAERKGGRLTLSSPARHA